MINSTKFQEDQNILTTSMCKKRLVSPDLLKSPKFSRNLMKSLMSNLGVYHVIN